MLRIDRCKGSHLVGQRALRRLLRLVHLHRDLDPLGRHPALLRNLLQHREHGVGCADGGDEQLALVLVAVVNLQRRKPRVRSLKVIAPRKDCGGSTMIEWT